jgi:hypothetical protein
MSRALTITLDDFLRSEPATRSVTILNSLRDTPELHAFTNKGFPPQRIALAPGPLCQLQGFL